MNRCPCALWLSLGWLCVVQSVSASELTDSSPPAVESSSPWAIAALHYKVNIIDLYAIALQESRRSRRDGTLRPWPWTLNSPKTGALYLHSYEEALAILNSLIAAGERNIDVGLMGINWHHNGHRADSPASLLQPPTNIRVAAQIYRENLDNHRGRREEAIARYHSGRPELGEPYAASVMTMAEHLHRIEGIELALMQ